MVVRGNYITESDIDNWAEDTTQEEMQEIIDRVEQTVERITGDFFYAKTFHEFFDGNGKTQIFPHFANKILSINKMVIADVEVDKLDFTGANISGSSGAYTVTLVQSGISADNYQNDYIGIYDASEVTNFYWGSQIISHTATSTGGSVIYTLADSLPMTLVSTGSDAVDVMYNWDYDENSIYRNPILTHHEPGELMEPYEFFGYDIFPKGKRNIEIWGTCGWRSCPKQIKDACIILARYENDNTLYNAYGYGMKSESLGDYSYTKSDILEKGKTLTGISEADRKIKMYIIRKPRLGVA